MINIQAVFLSEGQIEATRSFLKLRFQSANTLTGTRGFHHFEPLSDKLIGAKRVSIDKTYALQFDLVLGKKQNKSETKIYSQSQPILLFVSMMINFGLVL